MTVVKKTPTKHQYGIFLTISDVNYTAVYCWTTFSGDDPRKK